MKMHKKQGGRRWYSAVARNLGNTRILSKVDAVLRVESEDDIVFWRNAIHTARPNLKVKFLPCVVGGNGGIRQKGKTICMRYVNSLNSHYMICVDSDFDNFTRPGVLNRNKFILQTYTYSFENHYCYAPHLQNTWNNACVGIFSFGNFLKGLNEILYPILIPMLATKAAKKRSWVLDELCSKILCIQFNRPAFLDNDGRQLLNEIKQNLQEWASSQKKPTEASCQKMSTHAESIGMTLDNCYLYMQGHCIYNLIERIGRALCYNKSEFEYQILQFSLQLKGYNEAKKIVNDIQALLH